MLLRQLLGLFTLFENSLTANREFQILPVKKREIKIQVI